MKHDLTAIIAIAGFCCGVAAGQTINDPAQIDVYVTPYYNSKGPVIEVVRFSSGLAAKSESEFCATLSQMTQSWEMLNLA